MKKVLLRFLGPLVAAACLGVSIAPGDAPAPANAARSCLLENGMRVLLYEKHETPLVNISLAVNVGSKDESEGSLGLSHLLEHCLLFRGPGTVVEPGAVNDLRRNGAYFNGYTSQDLTTYEMTLPVGRAEFGLSVIKGIFADPDPGPDTLEREKAVILEEIGTLRDDPRRYAAFLIHENMFPGHPYGNALYGNEETIRNAGPGELRAFHGKYYVPSNCALAVVGDFAIADMERLVRAAVGGLQGPPPARTEPSKAKLLKKGVDIRKEMDVEEAYLAIGFAGPDYNHPDRVPADILTEILGRGFNPMLSVALRSRRDLVKSISMSYAAFKSGGLFIILYTLDPKDVAQARNETLSFLRKVRSLNFAKEDYYGEEKIYAFDFLQGAKNRVRFGAQRGRESGLNLASAFARHMLLAEGKDGNESYLERIERVASPDLRKIATRYMNQGEYVVVAIVPGKKR